MPGPLGHICAGQVLEVWRDKGLSAPYSNLQWRGLGAEEDGVSCSRLNRSSCAVLEGLRSGAAF